MVDVTFSRVVEISLIDNLSMLGPFYKQDVITVDKLIGVVVS